MDTKTLVARIEEATAFIDKMKAGNVNLSDMDVSIVLYGYWQDALKLVPRR